ncbi:MAG: ornithine--oxo-acid transaminase [Fimbriimonadaceae bacterium]|nr:ornithine--oxo-acid transaminase [Fimbriimonadaceae bacterium]
MQTKVNSLWQSIAQEGIGALLDRLSTQDAIDLAETYGTHNYKPLTVNIVRGEGAVLWDSEGKEYIDCIGCYSAVAHGHQNPAIIKAIEQQFERTTLVSRAVYTPETGLFLKGLAEYTGLDMVCPMNSGAEAVETCLKLARKWGYTKKGIEIGKAEIIVCSDNFHGRTTTIVGFNSEVQYNKFFGPYGPGFVVVPFGDLEAVKAAITPNTVAFMAEPIQAEGGIIIPPDGYLAGVRQLCDENNMLLIWDEVQTGFCRTGYKFGWQYEAAKPDLISVGKPLGGGFMPVSAAVGSKEVLEVFTPGDHGSTFGGNPLACVIGLAAMAEMENHDYVGKARRGEEVLLDGFKNLNSPLIKEIRGRGMLIGVEVNSDVDGAALSKNLVAEGLITKETRKRTFRFTPPIVTEVQLLQEIVARVGRALKKTEVGA